MVPGLEAIIGRMAREDGPRIGRQRLRHPFGGHGRAEHALKLLLVVWNVPQADDGFRTGEGERGEQRFEGRGVRPSPASG